MEKQLSVREANNIAIKQALKKGAVNLEVDGSEPGIGG